MQLREVARKGRRASKDIVQSTDGRRCLATRITRNRHPDTEAKDARSYFLPKTRPAHCASINKPNLELQTSNIRGSFHRVFQEDAPVGIAVHQSAWLDRASTSLCHHCSSFQPPSSNHSSPSSLSSHHIPIQLAPSFHPPDRPSLSKP